MCLFQFIFVGCGECPNWNFGKGFRPTNSRSVEKRVESYA